MCDFCAYPLCPGNCYKGPDAPSFLRCTQCGEEYLNDPEQRRLLVRHKALSCPANMPERRVIENGNTCVCCDCSPCMYENAERYPEMSTQALEPPMNTTFIQVAANSGRAEAQAVSRPFQRVVHSAGLRNPANVEYLKMRKRLNCYQPQHIADDDIPQVDKTYRPIDDIPRMPTNGFSKLRLQDPPWCVPDSPEPEPRSHRSRRSRAGGAAAAVRVPVAAPVAVQVPVAVSRRTRSRRAPERYRPY
jgi:hypothetical protein